MEEKVKLALAPIFAIDLRSLAAFRVGFGLVLLWDLGSRATDLGAHYTDFGILPRIAAIDLLTPWQFSLHLGSGAGAFEGILFALAAIFAVGLIIGFRTRRCMAISWFLLLSLQNRNPLVLTDGDGWLVFLAFWAMFMPLGARFSVDAALNRADGAGREHFFSLTSGIVVLAVIGWLLSTALLRTDPGWTTTGEAFSRLLSLNASVTGFGLWLRGQADVLPAFGLFVHYAGLIGPLLFLLPVFAGTARLGGIFLLFLQSLVLMLSIHLGLGPVVTLVALILFLPRAFWQRLSRRFYRQNTAPITIYYDQGSAVGKKISLLLREFLALRQAQILPAQGNARTYQILMEKDSWVVSDDSHDYIRWQALTFLVLKSPLFWPLGVVLSLPPPSRLGNRIYRLAVRRRGTLGRLMSALLPYRAYRFTAGRVATAVAVTVFLTGLYFNIAALSPVLPPLPAAVSGILGALNLDRRDSFLAPAPPREDGWPVIGGTLGDGRAVDVLAETAGWPAVRRPETIAAVYPDQRWRTYLLRILPGDAVQMQNFGRYLCRRWNRSLPLGAPLSRHEIIWNAEVTLRGRPGRAFSRRTVWRHDCFGRAAG